MLVDKAYSRLIGKLFFSMTQVTENVAVSLYDIRTISKSWEKEQLKGDWSKSEKRGQ